MISSALSLTMRLGAIALSAGQTVRSALRPAPALRYTTSFLPGELTAVSEDKKAPSLFPMFLKLLGRPCLVVGAGAVAESKIESLMVTGARVRVVAPEGTPAVHTWAAAKRIEWQQRRFQPGDLKGMYLVVAATSSARLHRKIYNEAKKRRVRCNVVDVPELCDFYYPSVVQRGALQIAISTAGKSPSLAQRLRKELEEVFGPEYEPWLEHLGKMREKIFAATLDPEERKRQLHRAASAQAFAIFRLRRNGRFPPKRQPERKLPKPANERDASA
jgi:precorrin-2 dehydrogenase / sirohydrochlorin ferrochelatase